MTDKPKAVAYLVNRYPAVSHSFIRREIEGLEVAGIAVHRISIRSPELPLLDEADRREASQTIVILEAGSIRLVFSMMVIALRHPRRFFRAWRTAGRMAPDLIRRLAYLLEASWLLKILRRAQISHIHAHFGTNPAAVARLAASFSSASYSFTVHGPDEFDSPVALDLGGKIHDAKFAVAISHYGRSQLRRWVEMSQWTKIVVVRCGLDERWFEPEAPAATWDSDLCTVARLAPQKGLPDLLEALSILGARGLRPRLVIVGEGPLRASLENQMSSLNLSNQIVFLGAKDEAGVKSAIRQTRAFVLPSFAEGLPVVLMEAMALGKPVISTRIAGIPELVDEQVGWLVPPACPQELANAIEAALTADPDRLAAIAAEAKARVSGMHSSRQNARQLGALF